MEGSSLGLMADSFDDVSVRANDERPIVVGVIVRPEARGAIVVSACLDSSPVELIHLFSIGRREG